MLYKAEELRTFRLRSTEGELGRIEDLYFDDRFWTVRYLVVDTGGWLVQRRVLVSPRAITGVDGKNRLIASNLTKAQLEKSPSPDEYPTVSRQFEIAYNEYYNYSPYWIGPFAWGAYTAPLPAEDAAALEERESWDGHLHGVGELTGFARYPVTASDGHIGHLSDVVVADDEWAVRYFLVDTHDWLPGKHILVPPAWAKVDWAKATVSVDLTREAVKEAPEYHADAAITREYEEELHQYYCRQGYWSEKAVCADSATDSPAGESHSGHPAAPGPGMPDSGAGDPRP